MAFPSITAKEMREIDRIMVEELGIGLFQMMEHAGRNLAEVARALLGGELSGKKLVVLVGPGHNGGGGLVGARHLANAGTSVVVVLARDPSGLNLKEVTARQYTTALKIGLGSAVFDPANPKALAAWLEPADLVIDALLGYSLSGPPRGAIAEIIRQANGSRRRILALDLPSGLHPDTGEASDPCIRAYATLTLGLPKRGLLLPAARPHVGRLWVGDIGIPPAAYARFGLEVGPLFSRTSVIPLGQAPVDGTGRGNLARPTAYRGDTR